MLNECRLQGIYIPIITPFLLSGELDTESFSSHLNHLLTHDIQGIVINGTTGESPTVAWKEVGQLVHAANASMRHARIPIIIGAGTNDTAASIRRAEQAGEWGADAVLIVTPYYSRPSQEGIVAHFRKISEVGVPVIAYEIPSRTGVRLDVCSMRRILDIKGVIGLKDSSGGVELVTALTASTDCKPILCGEDLFFHAMLSLGASGGMLASANVNTDAFTRVYRLASEGQLDEARIAFDQLLPLIQLLFKESNPAPLKWLLAQQGVIASDTLRLPMTPISDALQRKMQPLL